MKRKQIVVTFIGAALGIAIGYIAYAIGRAPQAHELNEWIIGAAYPFTDTWIDAILWAAGGAGVAAGLQYVRSENSN